MKDPLPIQLVKACLPSASPHHWNCPYILQNCCHYPSFGRKTHSITLKQHLIKTTNELLEAADSGLLHNLILLNLNAVYYTVCDPTLLNRHHQHSVGLVHILPLSLFSSSPLNPSWDRALGPICHNEGVVVMQRTARQDWLPPMKDYSSPPPHPAYHHQPCPHPCHYPSSLL